jgi:membrane fusion protein, adhesin transport system
VAEPRFLRQGVRVKAWVLLDQVSLGYELWRRMNAFPQAIDTAAPKRQKSKESKSE